MTDIKPVAWWSKGDSWEFIAGAEKPPEDFGPCVALYTEAQLRAAQVQVLREAAEKFKHDCDCGMPCDCYGPSTAKFQLLDMAYELGRSMK